MTRPNILWICTDQQRFDTLGCYGNTYVRTPNIDRLAEGGTLFESCFCQNPLCTPSRASFLTGRYPRTTRDRGNGVSIPADEVLVTGIFADAGYYCGLSGKLHISACNPKACPEMERRVEDGYAEFHWSHHPAPDWPGNEYIRWLSERGAEWSTGPSEASEHVRAGMPAELHQTTWCAEVAADFIRRRSSSGEPWLFSLNCFDPHHAFDPPPSHLERYVEALDEVPLPNYVPGELDSKPEPHATIHRGAYGNPLSFPYDKMSERDHRAVRAAYWAMVDLIDEGVGSVLAALDETGQREDTIVVFTSDHGELLGDHGMYLKGSFFYDPCVRVPLIVSWAGSVSEGLRAAGLVELTDLAPTLLGAAGLEIPERMQGRSLWPVLRGEADPSRIRDDVYCEHYGGAEPGEARGATMLRTELWKLVARHGTGTGELYDLDSDPGETRNLWDEPGARDAKLEMYGRLADAMARTVDPWPAREAAW